jgi:hypothetical protein
LLVLVLVLVLVPVPSALSRFGLPRTARRPRTVHRTAAGGASR